MKNYSTNPTTENAIEMFRTDAIGRNKEIFRFLELIDCIGYGCAIALNGEWGSGKTFFVKQVKLILDCNNPHSDMDEEIRNATIEAANGTFTALNKTYQSQESYATVYYDAWANDNADDPILSLVYTAIKNNHKGITLDNKKNIKAIICAIADVATGLEISKLKEQVEGTDFFESLKKADDVQQMVKKFIHELIIERANRLIIFIDELDRCKPEYAIKLLECIKHYFEDERVIFVFSVNLLQLQHTIKGYYGSDFDATRYIDKFFDLRISLPEIDYDSYIRYRFQDIHSSENRFYMLSVVVIKHFRLSIREIERFMRLVRITHNLKWNDSHALDIAKCYIIPFIIGLSMTDIEASRRFLNGVDSGVLCELLKNRVNDRMMEMLLCENECFSGGREIAGKTIISISDRIMDFYNALFPINPPALGSERIQIGKINFYYSDVRNEMNEILSLLSPSCDYNFE
jgi:hypothetical protein